MSPPTRSTDCEICVADRVSVPLKSRCSRKWLTPATSAGSSRAPTPIQTPIDAARVDGIGSTATVRPDGSRTMRSDNDRGSAVAPTAPVTPAAVAAVPVVASTAVVVRALTRRTEVTELVRQLGVERGLERDRLDATGLLRTSAGRRAGGAVARRLGDVAGRHEADLAPVVDLLDRHVDLLAEAEHVLDRIDALAAAELGDVH